MNGKQLKNSILQWAIQGKLVPQDPNDEPASVLLERIRSEKARLVKEGKIKKDKNESIIYKGDDNSYYEKFPDGKVVCVDEEIPFEIPEGWEWERWGHISLAIQYGYNAPAAQSGNAKMVRISDIQDNKLVWDTVPYCTIPEKDIDTYLLEPNDILFARTGGTVGKSFLVEDSRPNTIYAGYLIRTRYNSIELCPKYLKAYMESQLYWEQLHEGTIATAQPNCNGQTLSHMLLPIPPHSEQVRITRKLSEIEPIVDAYKTAQERLDTLNSTITCTLKKSILQYAIQGKLVPQDSSEEPVSALLERIAAEKQCLVKEGKIKAKEAISSIIFKGDDNKYYEKAGNAAKNIDDEIPFSIPSSWGWCRLDDICSYIHRGKSPKYSEIKKVPVVAQKCNQWSGFNIEKAQFIDPSTIGSYSAEHFLQQNDLLWNSTGLGTLGRMAMYEIEKNPYGIAVADSHVTVIRPISRYVNSKYLYYYFSSPTVQSVIEDRADGSTKQKELSTKTVSAYIIPLPPKAEQDRIVAKIEEVLASIMSR